MDITKWERQYGRIPYGAVVIMNSGWHKYYHDDFKYYGWDKEYQNNMSYTHFPGFSADSIEFLAAERKIVGIAVDTEPTVAPYHFHCQTSIGSSLILLVAAYLNIG